MIAPTLRRTRVFLMLSSSYTYVLSRLTNPCYYTDNYQNPTVLEDCSGIKVGNSYCVEVNNGQAPAPSSTSSTPPTPTGNGIVTPAPVREGMSTSCDAFYFVKTGDQCLTIASANGISLADFNTWNPSAGATCNGLWANTYVCVSIIGVGPVTTTSAKPSTTSAGNGIATPSPIQTGMVSNCDAFYLVKSGNECGTIASSNGITTAQFYAWNPAVGSTCSSLWLDTYVCVSIVGVSPSPSTTTKAAATTTKAAGNGVTTPTPIQTGMTTKCKTFHYVVSGDTCATMASKAGITLANFYAWNPAVGSTCSGLWLNTYACIAIL
jgi:LysM repeat protein